MTSLRTTLYLRQQPHVCKQGGDVSVWRSMDYIIRLVLDACEHSPVFPIWALLQCSLPTFNHSLFKLVGFGILALLSSIKACSSSSRSFFLSATTQHPRRYILGSGPVEQVSLSNSNKYQLIHCSPPYTAPQKIHNSTVTFAFSDHSSVSSVNRSFLFNCYLLTLSSSHLY